MKKMGCFGTFLMWAILLPFMIMYHFIKNLR